MASTTRDSLGLSQLQSVPPPPQYTEATAQSDVKVVDNSNYSHSPWLLRRTSIHVESTPNEAWQDDSSSHREVAPSIRSNDEKKRLRNLLTKFGNRLAEDHQSEDGSTYRVAGQPHDSSDFGTRVLIEAAQPLKVQTGKRHEMKGLEQAASVKRWPGNGNPAEPWGKLAKVNQYLDPTMSTRAAKRYRILSFGTLLETHWYITAINVHKPRSESSHPFWRARDQKLWSQCYRKATSVLPNLHHPYHLLLRSGVLRDLDLVVGHRLRLRRLATLETRLRSDMRSTFRRPMVPPGLRSYGITSQHGTSSLFC